MGRRTNNILYEKSLDFSVRIVNLSNCLKKRSANPVLIRQIISSGTSIGANFREAIEGISKADFLAKLYISLKEASETAYWLELLYKTNYLSEAEYNSIDTDCTELIKIINTIIKTTKKNMHDNNCKL